MKTITMFVLPLLAVGWALAADPQHIPLDLGAQPAPFKCSDPAVKSAKPGQYRHIYCTDSNGMLTVDGSPVASRLADLEQQDRLSRFKALMADEYIQTQALEKIRAQKLALGSAACAAAGIPDIDKCHLDITATNPDGTFDLTRAITHAEPALKPPAAAASTAPPKK